MADKPHPLSWLLFDLLTLTTRQPLPLFCRAMAAKDVVSAVLEVSRIAS